MPADAKNMLQILDNKRISGGMKTEHEATTSIARSPENGPILGSSPTSGAILNRLCGKGFLEEEWPLSVKVSVK